MLEKVNLRASSKTMRVQTGWIFYVIVAFQFHSTVFLWVSAKDFFCNVSVCLICLCLLTLCACRFAS